MKKVTLTLLIICIIIFVGIFYLFNSNKQNKLVETKELDQKYYDWNIKFVASCQTCIDNPTNLSSEELTELKDMLLGLFEQKEAIFDKFEVQRGFHEIYLNITDEANNQLYSIFEEKYKELFIRDVSVNTYSSKRIIHEEEQKTASSEEDIYYCDQNRECLKVYAGCCGCDGGNAVSINEDYFNYWQNKLNCPKDIVCALWQPACPGNPKCVNNRCVLI